MKILFRNESGASFYVYRGLAAALVADNHTVMFWDQETKPAFDMFGEFEPDIFIGQGYNLDFATIKCLNNNPKIKVFLKVGVWGPLNDESDIDEYPILIANDEEKNKVGKLDNDLVLFNYCHKNRTEYLIKHWGDFGKLWGLLLAADLYNFYPAEKDEKYKSDVVFVGGYWPYKGLNLDKYIIPLCYPVGKYNIKIFGNQNWSVPQYCGYINDEDIRSVLTNSIVCPNIHEPHSQRYGFEVANRIFNIVACKAFCITDKVESIYKDIFKNDEMVIANDPEDFRKKIDHFLSNPDERQYYIDLSYETVIKNHTYKHRVEEMMGFLV